MYLKVSILALFVLSAYAGSEEFEAEWKAMKDQWKASKEKCIEETGADMETMKELHKNKDLEVDRSIKCFGACMLKDGGSMNDDGTFNLEKALELIPQHMPEREKVVEAVTACAEKKEDDECETAHAFFTCVQEKKVFKHRADSSESEED